MRVLKICVNLWENESRDKRELSVCRELGLDTMVLAKGNANDKGRLETIDGLNVIRYSTRPMGTHIPDFINRFAALFTWARYVRKQCPEIISGHDIPGLLIGWMSNFFRRKKSKLVYGSQELELARNKKRNAIQKQFIICLERFLIRRAAFTIIPCDPAADELQSKYKLKNRPIVVRSTPDLCSIDYSICKEKRKEYLEYFKNENAFIILFHGMLTPGRGIENLIRLLTMNGNISLVVFGNGQNNYVVSLKKLAVDLQIPSRVLFHNAVPQNELWKYIGAADVGMLTIPATTKSYYYMLPNKFFENIQAETPIVCSDFPAVAPIVKKYNIGLLCNPENLNEINVCVERFRTDHKLYEDMKRNTKNAKEDLCWDKEKHVLLEAYKAII